MISVVWTIEVLAVPADREDNVRADASGAGLCGEVVGVPFRVHAGRIHGPTPVGLRVATVALLGFCSQVFGGAAEDVAREHAEALLMISISRRSQF